MTDLSVRSCSSVSGGGLPHWALGVWSPPRERGPLRQRGVKAGCMCGLIVLFSGCCGETSGSQGRIPELDPSSAGHMAPWLTFPASGQEHNLSPWEGLCSLPSTPIFFISGGANLALGEEGC